LDVPVRKEQVGTYRLVDGTWDEYVGPVPLKPRWFSLTVTGFYPKNLKKGFNPFYRKVRKVRVKTGLKFYGVKNRGFPPPVKF